MCPPQRRCLTEVRTYTCADTMNCAPCTSPLNLGVSRWLSLKVLERSQALGTDLEVVRCLIAHGADVDIWAESGTPLIFAVVQGHFAVAQALIDAGADVNVSDLVCLCSQHSVELVWLNTARC